MVTGTATNYPGIVIVTKDTDSKHFVGLVNDALDSIASKPVGAALLAGISEKSNDISFTSQGVTFTVKILPTNSQKKSILGKSWRVYDKGSVTNTMSDAKCCTPGEGAACAIKWDPKNKKTPDGSRPPFIALAHELIHCYHNLRGNSLMQKSKENDEAKTVGLAGYEGEPISENRIRREHGIAYRSQYNGRCEGPEWIPDGALLG